MLHAATESRQAIIFCLAVSQALLFPLPCELPSGPPAGSTAGSRAGA